MVSALEQLLTIASDPICGPLTDPFQETMPHLSREFPAGLEGLLKRKNGFYAFDNALHVFPSGCDQSVETVERWNSSSLWKSGYDDHLNEIVFFSEDLFGTQFGLQKDRVVKFEPETCEIRFFAEDLSVWALRILDEPDLETGSALATEWQERNGPLESGFRLMPKIPFVLGGEYSIENLYPLESVKGMQFRADLWKQIKDLPDGAGVSIEIGESDD